MSESEALLDLMLLDLVAVFAVVGIYLLLAKVRSLFSGFQGLQTEHYLRSRLRMRNVANLVRQRTERHSPTRSSRSPLLFWFRYLSRKGFSKALYRFNLERRLFSMLRSTPKAELDDIAFSLMFWRRKDCPNEELYIARPPHHMALHDADSVGNARAAEERKQRLIGIRAKSKAQVLEWITSDVRRRSSSSVQWLYDSLNQGWVGDVGTTRSRAIRLTEENEVSRP